MKKPGNLSKKSWSDKVGVYPTPSELVAQFTKLTVDTIKRDFNEREDIDLLDLFAGDGRLGISVKELLRKNNFKVNATYIEIQNEESKKITEKDPDALVLNKNVFEWHPNKKYTLIVSNPPYLILNSYQSEKLGFSWDYVKSYGRNLYTLGILNGIDLCKENGILAVISPFSWLRAEFSAQFRDEINEMCSHVFIKANEQRTVFKDVNQDIGIQIFIKRSSSNKTQTDWKFGYNGYKPKKILFEHLVPQRSTEHLQYRTMVGPVVWNRKEEFLTDKKTNNILLVYGGNIGHDGMLQLNIDRYKTKQYIRREGLLKTDIFSSPVILIRRIMRGIPGNWTIDSCLLEKGFVGTAENHVIIIEIPKDKVISFKTFHKKIMHKIKEYYYFSGSPSISVKVVKQILIDLGNPTAKIKGKKKQRKLSYRKYDAPISKFI